jgi:aspartyl-tRNA(Asn)/glutamyl-tRNA(Gln) amidotransferase subunit A
MENNDELTIERLAPRIRQKKISPVELTKFMLGRIERLQPVLNAYITIEAEGALAQAKAAEKEISKGRYRGPLHGIPVNVKDLFYTRGIRTTAGSKILQEFVPSENAGVVGRLLNAGCILLGKTNMHEFAYGATNVNPHYGAVRNPWDTTRISGGSSGGSAASVVSAQAIASFGTDTGGSIRIPSALCGCVGYKPTFGRIPTGGVFPLSGSLDHAGPISRSVLDAALMFDAVVDPGLWGVRSIRTIGKIRKDVKGFKIGIPREYFFDHIHPDVRRAVLAAIDVFKQLGANTREIDLNGMEETARIAADITGCEALAIHEKWLQDSPERYGEDVRIRLEQNRTTPATAYIQALRNRDAYMQEFARALDSVDVLLAPTTPIVAPTIDEKEADTGTAREDVRSALLRLTRPGNLSGLPAISLPCGVSAERLPVGLQLIGGTYDEPAVFRAAYAYECATPWHRQFPVDPEIPGPSES